jgi:hypothetical protein
VVRHTHNYSLRIWTTLNRSLAWRPSHISSYGCSYLSQSQSTVSIHSLQSTCWLSLDGPVELNPPFPSISPVGFSPPALLLRSFFWSYRWIHAVRAIRSGSITRSFLDPLAVRIQSIRFGRRGRGYRRFLVFAELTKDRKAAEYVALYAYFSFQCGYTTMAH